MNMTMLLLSLPVFLATLVIVGIGLCSQSVTNIKASLRVVCILSILSGTLIWIGVSLAYENPDIPFNVKMTVVGKFIGLESKPMTVLQWSATKKGVYDNQIIVEDRKLGGSSSTKIGTELIRLNNNSIIARPPIPLK